MPDEDSSVPAPLLAIPEGKTKPVESRVKNGASARAIVARLIQDDADARKRRAVVDGWVAGVPPYNEASRKARGLDWTANVNFMGGKALMDSSAVPYYQIFNGVQCYVDVRASHDKENTDYELWNQKISKHFHNLCSRWKQFDFNIQNVSHHMRKHGVGVCFFEKHNDWRFRSIPSGMTLAPRGCPSCVDKTLRYVAIRVPYTVVELWEFIKDDKTSKALGYLPDAVKLAIKQAGQGLLGDRRENWYSEPWDTFAARLMDDDIATSSQSDVVMCSHLLVQEFSGKVSHFIVTESELLTGDMKQQGKKDEQFLYRHANRYDSFDDALVAFFQNIGEGTWHSVRGLADDAFKHGEAENRLMNRMLDGAFIGSSLVLKPGTTANKDKLQLTQWGPVTLIPAGSEVMQPNLSGALDGPVVALRIVKNNAASNIGQFNPRSLSREDGRGEQPTARQIDAETSHGTTLSQGQMTLFYLNLDSLFTQMFKRAADPNTTDEEAKRFQKECADDGVPKKALANPEYVRANRASGYGSPQVRQMVNRHLMEMGVVAMLPEEGKQRFLDDTIGGEAGADKVERYNPKERLPDRNDADAAMENSMIKNGDMPVMISGQNNVIHMQSHLEHAAEQLAPVKEAMQTKEADQAMLEGAYQYVQLMGAHCEEHLGHMHNDPSRKDLADYFEDKLKSLVSFSSKLYAAIRTAMREAELAAKEQEQATALGALDQAKVASTLSDIQRANAKTANAMANQTRKTIAGIRLNSIKTAASVADQARKAAQPKQKAA
jgi:hypothetical protein